MRVRVVEARDHRGAAEIADDRPGTAPSQHLLARSGRDHEPIPDGEALYDPIRRVEGRDAAEDDLLGLALQERRVGTGGRERQGSGAEQAATPDRALEAVPLGHGEVLVQG